MDTKISGLVAFDLYTKWRIYEYQDDEQAHQTPGTGKIVWDDSCAHYGTQEWAIHERAFWKYAAWADYR